MRLHVRDEDGLRTVIDAEVWHRGMTLLEASSYFEVLRVELGPAAERFVHRHQIEHD